MIGFADMAHRRIVATARLILEKKLTRQCGTVGGSFKHIAIDRSSQTHSMQEGDTKPLLVARRKALRAQI